MDEHSSDEQPPGIWESWTSSADPSSSPETGASGQGSDSAGAGESGAPDATSQLQPFTEPIGNPQAGYLAGPGYVQPSLSQPSPSQPSPSQPSLSEHSYSGYGYQPGGGFGQPPGGGFGQPPGGYGGSGTYGGPPRPARRRALTTAITYLAVAAIAATAGGLVVAFADNGQSPASSAGSSGSGNLGQPGSGIFPGGGFGGNGSSSGSSSANISQSTLARLKAAITPGLVIITSNLKYDGTGVGAEATGMILSHNGLVLTNNHVINQTTGLEATVVATGKHYEATWLGYDKGADVAVIKLDGASGLDTVPIGNSATVKVGDQVVGMGNANGAGRISYVPGTITNLDQTITASDDGSGLAPERLTGMLQTNAQIIPGDSGGPLVSTDGKVIGMDTAASTSSIDNSGQNVGFAIPINRAIGLARQIIAGKSGSGVRIGSSGFVGVLVPSGPNGTQSRTTDPSTQLHQQESSLPYGQFTPAPSGCVQNDQNAGIPTKIAPVSSGTLVLGALCQTSAATAGIVAGDVITKVNNQPVSSPESLMDILQRFRAGSSVKLTWVTPGDQTVTRSVMLTPAPPQ